MARLAVQALAKRYGAMSSVDDVNLTVEQGELVALLGPSGCGKTTTLRMIAGFVSPSSGRISIGDNDVTERAPHARNIGMVFQSYALFPHMSVAKNVSFGLEMRGIGRAERDIRVTEALRLVRLQHLADRMPRQLSGGEQQRVALARALVIRPAILLLDEPLSNLDAKLRGEVRLEIRNLQQRLQLTTLMVTHDQEEALTMADRLVVMKDGRLQQIGTPKDLYERPADTFVANFVGRCNLIAGEIVGRGQFKSASGIMLPCGAASTGPGNGSVLAIRPEKLEVEPNTGNGITARLIAINYLGPHIEYHLDFQGTPLVAVRPLPSGRDPLNDLRGQLVSLRWEPAATQLLANSNKPEGELA
ncbi:ABC transporter ATP-binding protein [Mesorhizobium sp. M0510]|uniref:ABC transporter ATP-binding protein n=1 Tax=Mesorhizobium sp. M0510 TaxID=2956954 RepID=UPI00333AE405